MWRMTGRLRGQARSHRDLWCSLNPSHPRNLWERACPRRGPISHHKTRRQKKAPSGTTPDGAFSHPESPTGICGAHSIQVIPKPVGAGLPAKRPDQPPQNTQTKKAPPGTTPDGAFSHPESPTGICGAHSIQVIPKPVGAGLPAKRPDQPPQNPQTKKAPPGTTPDGAFSHPESPTGICGVHSIQVIPKPVGASLPAKRPDQPPHNPQTKKAPPGTTPDGAFSHPESPTGIYGVHSIQVTPETCGSGLAREEARSATT
jgi:hypothetical protein